MKAAEVNIFEDGSGVARAAAEIFTQAAHDRVGAEGRFSVVFSGGSTPGALFALLAGSPLREQVPWQRVHIFWGDERMVPPDHPESNFGAAKRLLLERVDIPGENIHRIRGEMDPRLAAQEYEAALRQYFSRGTSEFKTGEEWPPFDLVYLGMGDDGHTASLFPGTAALHELNRWVVANHVPKLDTWRVTLTQRRINAAGRIVFMVTGAGKSEALKQVLEGPRDPERFPAQLIWSEKETLVWLVDREASRGLKNGSGRASPV